MSISVDCHQRTIMHIAASNPSNECLDTIYTFVKDKQDILKKDTMGYTPLHYAVKYGMNFIIKISNFNNKNSAEILNKL